MTRRGLLALVVVGACGGAPRPLPHGPTSDLAIADAIGTADGGVLARTDDGGIVMLDAQLRVTWRNQPASKVTAIAVIDGDAYLGHEDGTIETLGHVPDRPRRVVARVDGVPRWFAVKGGHMFVMTDGRTTGFDLYVDTDTDGERVIQVERDDLGSAKRGDASAFALLGDSFWFGTDAGEWGGRVVRMELASGESTVFHDFRQPVHGFAVANDRLLVYGGLRHMHSNHGFVGEIVRGEAKTLKNVRPGVSALVADGDGYLVVTWDHLQRVDATFQQWKPVARIPLREDDRKWPRPLDVRTLLKVGSRVVIATPLGFFELRGSKFVPAGT